MSGLFTYYLILYSKEQVRKYKYIKITKLKIPITILKISDCAICSDEPNVSDSANEPGIITNLIEPQ